LRIIGFFGSKISKSLRQIRRCGLKLVGISLDRCDIGAHKDRAWFICARAKPAHGIKWECGAGRSMSEAEIHSRPRDHLCCTMQPTISVTQWRSPATKADHLTS